MEHCGAGQTTSAVEHCEYDMCESIACLPHFAIHIIHVPCFDVRGGWTGIRRSKVSSQLLNYLSKSFKQAFVRWMHCIFPCFATKVPLQSFKLLCNLPLSIITRTAVSHFEFMWFGRHRPLAKINLPNSLVSGRSIRNELEG